MKDNLIEFEGELHKPKKKFPYLLMALNILYWGIFFIGWDEIHMSTKLFCLFLGGYNFANLLNKF